MKVDRVTHPVGRATRNPYVFLVGCPRSGTTLLKRMVDAHSQMTVPNASYWIPRWFEKRKGLAADGSVTPKLITRLLAHPKFRMGVGRPELEALIESETPVSYATFVGGIFDLYAEANGKPLVGDKTPGYVQKIATLHSLWPSARFVHLIRDGRDVCLSAASWADAEKKSRHYSTWKSDPVSTAALWWEWQVRLGREAGRRLGDDLYHEIRYDSLVESPRDECATLCSFLDVPLEEEAMTRYHEGRTNTSPDLNAKAQWLPATPGLRDWRSQMSEADLGKFEAVAGDLLDELGYGRSLPAPAPDALQEASRLRESFNRDILARRGSLPERWGRY